MIRVLPAEVKAFSRGYPCPKMATWPWQPSEGALHSVFPPSESAIALNERKEKGDFLPHPSCVEPSFGNSGSSGGGKLRLPLYVGGAPGSPMATPAVKKPGYVSVSKKTKDAFCSEISHVYLPPHQETSPEVQALQLVP